ncbi:MAG TPA: protein translocase subunit SecF [Candidatus Acidoferrales bacterium]|nr:protein translocase subunit SecF [Candidatus Acidoferrales bacterium]
MEFFHQPNYDWMGKAKYFVSLSLFLLLVGVAAGFWRHGLTYDVDFKGGTLVDVRFAQAPDIDVIRKDLQSQGLGRSEIVPIHDISHPNANEVEIDLPEQSQDEQTALDQGKTRIVTALQQSFGAGESNKQDFNAASAGDLTDYLVRRDPLSLGAAAGNRYTGIGTQLAAYRDKNRDGIVTNLDDLKNSGVPAQVVASLHDGFYTGSFAIRNVQIVGPKVGADLRRQAVFVTLYALAGMLVYIAIRFEWIYGAAAVIAVFHDVLITLGLFALLKFPISLTVIAALLTLVGYSMNDTIVIFDRVRENNRLMRREPFPAIVNRSINQTLSRTILTSGLTFLTVLVLFLMGGPALRSFSFALVIGIVVGTYSSFGIAAPMVVAWNHWRGTGNRVATRTGPQPVTKPGTAKRSPA